jgi:hypothetical protein
MFGDHVPWDSWVPMFLESGLTGVPRMHWMYVSMTLTQGVGLKKLIIQSAAASFTLNCM